MGVGDLYNVLFVTFCLGEGGGGTLHTINGLITA